MGYVKKFSDFVNESKKNDSITFTDPNTKKEVTLNVGDTYEGLQDHIPSWDKYGYKDFSLDFE